jgi:hypothetical protein
MRPLRECGHRTAVRRGGLRAYQPRTSGDGRPQRHDARIPLPDELFGDIVSIEAFELKSGHPAGYQFQIELGFEKAATSICAGIILGLYRCRRGASDLALNWAPDFPAETAKEAVAILARESSQRHHHVWCVLDALVARVPEWAQSERQSAP